MSATIDFQQIERKAFRSMETRKFTQIVLALFGLCAFSGISLADDDMAAQKERIGVEQYLKRFNESAEFHDDDVGYAAAFVDLDGDGKKEVIVYLSGHNWCGSAGCLTLVLAPQGDTYRLISQTGITHTPIRLLDTTSHGWRDLSVQVAGGGFSAHEAVLSFDGKSYPANPTVPPAHPVIPGVAGTTLIEISDSGRPLYH